MSLNKVELAKIKQLNTGQKKFKESVELILVFSGKVSNDLCIDFSPYAKKKKYILFANSVPYVPQSVKVISPIEFTKHESKKLYVKNHYIIVHAIKQYNAIAQNKTYNKILKTKPHMLKTLDEINTVVNQKDNHVIVKTACKKSISLKIAEDITQIDSDLISKFEDVVKSMINLHEKKNKKIRILKIYLKTTMGTPIRIR